MNPGRAFASIATTREWVPAYLVLVILGLVESFLEQGALAHLIGVEMHSGGAAPKAADVAKTVTSSDELQALWTFTGPFILWGVVAAMLASMSMFARGTAVGYSTCFSLCVNCALPLELGQLLQSVVIRLRDPASFTTLNDFSTALPLSLAVFHPHGSPAEIAFLSYWQVFTLWTLVLLGCGYAYLAKVALVPALLLSLGVGLALALAQVAVGP